MSMDNEQHDLQSERPEAKLDSALQREVDEALGDTSLEDLLAEEESKSRAVRPNAQSLREGVRKGLVVGISGEDIFVDIGGHRQGVVPIKQFTAEDFPAVGDQINVVIEGFDPDDELVLLAREGAITTASWETLEKGQVVEGRVTGTNTGGLELNINGLRAFMPVSQIDVTRIEDVGQFVNQRLQCKVMEVERGGKRLIVSRRAILEEETAKAAEQLWETLEKGQIVHGTVKTIKPYGAFVDIGGIDGLLHVSDMSYARIDNPRDVVTEGQELQVQITKIDRENQRLSLGLKQILADPWENAANKYAPDAIVEGTVTRLADFGAFVELEGGIEGLIPMGELAYGRRINRPDEVVKVGDHIKVRVMTVEPKRRRIGLSLKRVEDDPWMGASVRFAPDSIVEGTVTRIADFGAFVQIAPGVEGMVHISELSFNRVRAVSDVVKEGQAVQAKVLSVDEEKRRIALSIKATQEPTETASSYTEQAPSAPAQPARKRKTPLKGGLEGGGLDLSRFLK